jgi:hypothetical protein
MQIMLDDLAWWSSALAKARTEGGELLPGTMRVRAATARVPRKTPLGLPNV